MKMSKFYLFPILHVVLIYSMSFALSWLVDYVPEDKSMLFLFDYIACIGIMNIVACKKYCKAENERVLLVSALIVKYGLIPFFVILACVALSSPYAIAYLHSSHKAGNRHIVVVWIHTILQFFFCLDVLDMMFLSIKGNVWRKLSIGLLVVFILAVIVGFVAIVLGIAKLFVAG